MADHTMTGFLPAAYFNLIHLQKNTPVQLTKPYKSNSLTPSHLKLCFYLLTRKSHCLPVVKNATFFTDYYFIEFQQPSTIKSVTNEPKNRNLQT